MEASSWIYPPPVTLQVRQRSRLVTISLRQRGQYLTEWDGTLKLNPKCRRFRFIVGEDFGITRKAACEAVLRWLPHRLKANFRVAVGNGGFPPKGGVLEKCSWEA